MYLPIARSRIIAHAMTLLSMQGTWTFGFEARARDGDQVSWDNPSAMQWCQYGAMRVALKDAYPNYDHWRPMEDIEDRILTQAAIYLGYNSLWDGPPGSCRAVGIVCANEHKHRLPVAVNDLLGYDATMQMLEVGYHMARLEEGSGYA